MQRAHQIINIIKGFTTNKSEDFISIENEIEFQNSFRNCYDLGRYLTYKIVYLIEKKSKIEIIRLTNEFYVKSEKFYHANIYWSNTFGLEYQYKRNLCYKDYLKKGEIGSILVKNFRGKSFSPENAKEILKKTQNCRGYLQIMDENYKNLKKSVLEKEEISNLTKRIMIFRKRTQRKTESIKKIAFIHDNKEEPKSPKKNCLPFISDFISKNPTSPDIYKKKFNSLVQEIKKKTQINL